jgi:O-antigen/teichoic acid export membrane protein
MAVPFLTYAERLLIGGLRSLTELAYYAVPFEIVARTAIIPSAVALTLFPAFSQAQRSGAHVDQLFRRPMRLLFLLQWPLLVFLWLFPRDILAAWVGPNVADAGAVVLRLLAAAFFLNAFSQVALAGIQGLGRPDLKARLDLVEVPLFILLAVLLIPRFGIAGAAGAKLLVTFADTALLFLFAGRLSARPMIDWSRLRRHPVAAGATILVVSLVGFSAAAPLTIRIVAALAGIILLGGAVWMRALDDTDRAAVLSLFGRRAQMKEVTQ